MSVIIKVHSPSVKKILKSEAVREELLRHAKPIAAAANANAGLSDGFIAGSEIGQNRARAYVVTATADAMIAEARTRALTRAFDAGRG